MPPLSLFVAFCDSLYREGIAGVRGMKAYIGNSLRKQSGCGKACHFTLDVALQQLWMSPALTPDTLTPGSWSIFDNALSFSN